MTIGYGIKFWIAAGLLGIAACSSSSSTNDSIALTSVRQDLVVDPDGRVTVFVFAGAPGAMTAANFEADGGQSALTVVESSGILFTVTWDERVTPSHRVRVVGKANVSNAWRPVTTTDPSAPTFTVAGTQTLDGFLGGDTMTVTFSGPRVIEVDAEDITNWTLDVGGTALDLTGSTFDLNPVTQVMDVTLGAGANLHASFTLSADSLTSVADVDLDGAPVTGAATGDTTGPGLDSVEQNLTEDEFGRVVDFTFDEPMDPNETPQTSHFAVDDHPDSAGVTFVTNVEQVSDSVIRVTCSGSVVPGLDRIIVIGLVDAHGNPYPNGTEDVANSTPAGNGFDTVTANQVENYLGDTIVVTTTQAFDPDLAVDPTNWSLLVDGNPVDLLDQTLTYSFLAKELTIELDFDLQNDDPVQITAIDVVEVDGETFNAVDASATASGDDGGATVLSVIQNRTVDPSGMTVDVSFDEDVDALTAEDVLNWTFSGGLSVDSASVQASFDVVRLVADDVVLPGAFTLTASTDIEDLAGNTMVDDPQDPMPISSTDTTAPSPSAVFGNAIEGAGNDTIVVSFNDDMVAADVMDETNWFVESPSSFAFDIAGTTIVYDAGSRQATATLPGADQNLKTGDDVRVSFTTMRDIGGNIIAATPAFGSVTAESSLPAVHTVWRDPGTDVIEVRFTEPCDELDDLYDAILNPFGTRFALRIGDGGPNDGDLRGYPSTTNFTVRDGGLGVTLEYGFLVDATDTVDVLGVTDLAGNYMFPAMAVATVDEDLDAPGLDGSSVLNILSGESNDEIFVDFTENMSPWKILNPANYAVTLSGGPPMDLSDALFDWDGGQLITITLGGDDNLANGTDYDVIVNVDAANPLRTSQGVPLGAPITDPFETASGDSAVPTISVSGARMEVTVPTSDADSVFVVFSEAVNATAVEAPANFVLDGKAADSVVMVGPRVAQATWEFSTDVNEGGSLEIFGDSIIDLAGNFVATPGGNITVAVTSDVSAPVIGSATGTISPGAGGDFVTISFTEQLDLVTALDPLNYTLTNGSVLSLSGATLSYESATPAVRIGLASGVEIDVNLPLSVGVSNVSDVAGTAITGTTTVGAAVSGDSTPPDIEGAFVNWREDPFGTVVDFLFTEDVDTDFAGDEANWFNTGSPTVSTADVISGRHVRLTLSDPIGASDQLQITGLEDLARNLSGLLAFDPFE